MALDLMGKIFGRLFVLEDAQYAEKGHKCWVCLCECGNFKTLKSRSLLHDNIRSCGCLLKWKVPGYKKRKHYHTWINIIYRCYKKESPSYKKYGAKGIKVCKLWRYDYWAFHNWMEENNWRKGLQVDRYPNKNGNYEPSNCRLATQKMQNNNRNDNVPLEFKGMIKNSSEWAIEYGISPGTFASRIKKGWGMDTALNTPVGSKPGYLKRKRKSNGTFN